ncbi:MAG: nicotinate-nucleotide--dimethylbenzimidazole phosphoribosyltransferase, partial [Planctomycetota bacterium]
VTVVDMGAAADLDELAERGAIISKSVRPGTDNIAEGPAMSRDEARRAVEGGIEVAHGLDDEVDVFGTGDMGIGNTTPSAAIAAAVTGLEPSTVTGRGTGIDDEGLQHKIEVVETALTVNDVDPADGLDLLSKVGGFEIGGIAGLILGAASRRKPVLIDGFISTAGAVVAQALCPDCADYMIAAHRSEERGHAAMHEKLGKEPLLDLDLRLGEGTGAALAMNLVDAAASLLTDVNTFEEAAVTAPGTGEEDADSGGTDQ